MSPRLATVAPWVLAVAAALLLAAALRLPPAPLSPQSLANLAFAAEPDYGTALAALHRVWPPLYPSLLWLGDAVSLAPHAVGVLLFAGGLALLVPVGRRLAPAVHPAWWIALYAASGFHVPLLQQVVSETLLVPLALALTWALVECVRGGRPRNHVLVGSLLAACCLTRYFALVWLLPPVFVVLALRGAGPPRARVLRAAATVGAAALPVLAWMLHARLTTGYLTGMDRFSPRVFDDRTTLFANLLLGARTLFVDWFLPGRSASHAAVGRDWALEPAGAVVALGAVALAGLCVRGARGSAAATPPGVPAWLLPGLSFGYLAAILVVWTAGNNDPLYTRFLYPSYVFFGLTAVHVYSNVKSAGAGASRRPFQALYAWLLAAQAAGSALRLTAGEGGAG